jgi:hypothetical protein
LKFPPDAASLHACHTQTSLIIRTPKPNKDEFYATSD